MIEREIGLWVTWWWWLDLGVGCSHNGQIGSGVGCSWWSDWLRDESFTAWRAHDGLIYFPMAPTLSMLHCKCSPLFSSAQRGTWRRYSLKCGVDLGLASKCGVELYLSLVGAWGEAEVSLEMNFKPCEECVRSENLWKWLEGKMSLEMLQVWGPNFTVNAMIFRLTKFYIRNQTHGRV